MFSTIIRWALTRLAALSLVVFGVSMVPNAAHGAEVPPPAPTFLDYCGALDEAYIPVAENATYYRDVVNYDAALAEGTYHSVAGATYVKIIAEYVVIGDDGWGYTKQQVFEHTFDTSAPNGCAQAQDTGAVAVGACDQSTGRTQLTISVTNEDDLTEIPHDWIEFLVTGGGGAMSIPITTGKLLDGQTVAWTGGLDVAYPFYPGYYVGQFMTMKPHRVIVSDVKFTVPACGDYPLVGSGDNSGGSAALPTAKLKLVKCKTGRVKATFNNKRGTAVARVKLSKKRVGGKAVSRTYKVKPRSVLPVYSSGNNTVFKAFVWNAKTKKWVKRDRLRTPLQSRCG
jgi:hypothetical protein